MTQCERIIKYCKDFGAITTLDAMRDLGILRLASRITDLKKAGYKVTKSYKAVTNRYGERTSVVVYKVEEGKHEQ